MPKVSPANCVPILQSKIERFSSFIDKKKNDTGGTAVSGAAWQRFVEVIEQMRNVHGVPTKDQVANIISAIHDKRA